MISAKIIKKYWNNIRINLEKKMFNYPLNIIEYKISEERV